MKICTVCGTLKDLSEFSKKTGGALGINSKCKMCNRVSTAENKRTKRGLLSKIYNSQQRSSSKRKMEQPLYEKEEFISRFINDKYFESLYEEWIASGYNRWKIPSFDRVDDYLPYSFSNIELKTWKENSDKAAKQRLLGESSSGARNKKIRQLDLDGSVIKEFLSINQAARELGLNSGNILQVVNNKKRTSGGFKWEEIIVET